MSAVRFHRMVLTRPSTQDCFEGDAEVIQDTHKDSSLHFEEEETCVHPIKPDFDEAARMECDSASEGDPEASSLAGSVRHSLSTFGLLHFLSALFLYETTLQQPAQQLLLLWPVLNLIIMRSAYNDSCMLHTQPF